MAKKLFVTGVSGYVGGDFLYAAQQKHPEWHITALVRNEAKASKIAQRYPDVKFVIGDNESAALIENEVAKADIIFHFANSADDEPSAKAIAAGLRKSSGFWIHTSGTYILVRPNIGFESYGIEDGETYDDDTGINTLVNLPDAAPHRNIDKIVLAAGSEKVKTAIVCPPAIYGRGRGPGNQRSIEPYKSAEATLRNKRGFIYGEGKNPWHQVHVHDLSELYILLGEAAANGGSPATWNQEGYYLAENGSFAWGDILQAVATAAHQKGYIPSAELEKLDPAQAKGKYPLIVGTTSKGVGYRAKKLLGWTPSRPSMLEEVPNIVDSEAASLGL